MCLQTELESDGDAAVQRNTSSDDARGDEGNNRNATVQEDRGHRDPSVVVTQHLVALSEYHSNKLQNKEGEEESSQINCNGGNLLAVDTSLQCGGGIDAHENNITRDSKLLNTNNCMKNIVRSVDPSSSGQPDRASDLPQPPARVTNKSALSNIAPDVIVRVTPPSVSSSQREDSKVRHSLSLPPR